MKILVIAGHAPSLMNFRGHLLRCLVQQGHEVLAVAPELSGQDDRLHAIGVKTQDCVMDRTGSSFWTDLKTLRALTNIIREYQPDCVFGYTAKPVIYGSLAARWVGTPRIHALITGLGYAFSGVGWKRRIIRYALLVLYRPALRSCRSVIFQNPDDRALFERYGLVQHSRTQLVNGSGVDTDYFQPAIMPALPIRFLLIARLLKEKGILEYVEAAKQLKQCYPEIRCGLLGPVDPNPGGIAIALVREWHDQGWIDYLGEVEDVRPALRGSHVCVLPSYREGTPRAVLEAMAMAKPIITTDVPGCRETVVPGQNGWLTPPQNVHKLVEAMARFIAQPELIPVFGECSLRLAVQKYDVHKVNQVMVEALTGDEVG